MTSALTKVVFLSDLDGTWLSKNPQNRQKLDAGVQQLHDEFKSRGIDFQWGYVTARPPERVAHEALPDPAWTITYNGGMIQQGGPGHYDGQSFVITPQYQPWDDANRASNFNATQVMGVVKDLLAQSQYHRLSVHTVGQVVNAPAADACPYMEAICFDDDSIDLLPGETAADLQPTTFKDPAEIEQFMADLKQRLDAAHVKYQLSSAYPFAGKPIVMFDATSPLADKGDAVSFVRDMEHLPSDHLIVAGDGGNDITMMRAQNGSDDGRRAIVVGGLPELYQQAQKLAHVVAQPASMDCSLGVLDGLRQHLNQIAAEQGT